MKITQFRINPHPEDNIRLFGLGDDNNMYWWDWNKAAWILVKNEPKKDVVE